GKDSCQGDS
nr:Chain P, 9-mer peptide from Trypsin [Sus scrofa]